MQLICHSDAYTDEALAIASQGPVHHNGSNRKKQRPYLVHRACSKRVFGFICETLSPYERIRCTGKPRTHQRGVAILAAFAFAASTRWPTQNSKPPIPSKISFLRCRNIGPSEVASFCIRTTWT